MKDPWTFFLDSGLPGVLIYCLGTAGIVSALIISSVILFTVSSPKRAGALFFFTGFLVGFVVAVTIAHYIKPKV
ncbi:hypothetical protein [Thermococcus sp.]|uniref:hypothetical protein n=1 Tax=Thermococcus sp. TaxID=35749 RepID=UPI00262C0E34|nr:hypothetical protein [Thermococcus sp.]